MTVDGIDLNVLVEGEGEPVLLLHGFPDSNSLWRHVIPRLIAAGHQGIAPDLRGFGLSDAPEGVRSYRLERLVKDTIAILDALELDAVKVVGHDWGAVVGWLLAGLHPSRVESYVAVSTGHPRAYALSGWKQKLKGWYVVLFQFPGLAEKAIVARNWSWFRKLVGNHPESDRWIEDLSRPGRLTAGMSWYRANFIEVLRADFPRVNVPVLGIWSTGDTALAEDQMRDSARNVDAPWRYERFENVGHWIPLDEPERLSDLIVEYFASASGRTKVRVSPSGRGREKGGAEPFEVDEGGKPK